MERVREWKKKQRPGHLEYDLTTFLASDAVAFKTLFSQLKMELSALTLNFLAFSSLR